VILGPMTTMSTALDPTEREMVAAAFLMLREAVQDGRLEGHAVLEKARYTLGTPDAHSAREAFNATAARFAVSPPIG
jgi:hypothetical protein